MKILIIEDDKDIWTLLRDSLKSESFAVNIAEDGEKGLAIAKIEKHDLIIMDVMLPKKNGLVLCKEIRENNIETPILVLSAKTETESKIELLNAGADDYLTKPYSLEELMSRVKALLRRPKNISNQVLKIDNLTVDIDTGTIKRGGKIIYLRKKEFALLRYLMINMGQVLSRENILEHVWDMNANPFSNTVESHILNLRKKINNNNIKLIHTIPGRGYKIDNAK